MDGWYITYEKMRCNFSINFSVPETEETGKMIVKRGKVTNKSVTFLEETDVNEFVKDNDHNDQQEPGCMNTTSHYPLPRGYTAMHQTLPFYTAVHLEHING